MSRRPHDRPLHHADELGDPRLAQALERRSVPDPGPAFETRLRARLEARIREHEARRSGRRAWLAPRRLALGGALAALLVATFFAGSRLGPRPSPDEVRERIVHVAVGEHLERTERLLVEIVNPEAGTLPALPGGRERAGRLATSNRLLRASLAADPDPTPLSELLEDLEAVLVEIANSPTEPTAADWQRVTRRIRKRGLLLRLDVLGDRPGSLAPGRPSRPTDSISA